MFTNWKKTEEALASLQVQLKCEICKSLAEDPIKYSCNDFFCRGCVDRGSSICPSCGIQSRATEVVPDQITAKLICGWKMLAGLVNATKFGVDPYEENSPADPVKKSVSGDIPEAQKETDTQKNLPAAQKKAFTPKNAPVKPKKVVPKNTPVGQKKAVASKSVSSEPKEAVQKNTPVEPMKTVKVPVKQKKADNKLATPAKSVDLDESVFGCETPREAINNSNNLKTPRCHKPLKELMKRNKKGETPLHVACIKGNLPQLKSLLAAGANPNTKDNAGYTPLHEAVSQGFTEVVELLLDAGAFVDVPGVDNMTALHEAVLGCKIDIVKLLVSHGADPAARTSYGKTVKDFAVSQEIKDALETPVGSDVSLLREPSKWFADVEPVVCFAGLDKSSKTSSATIATSLGMRVVQTFSNEITHLIVATDANNVCPPTVEVLFAMACGCWIINRDWLSLRLESKELVDPALFEICGITDYIGDGPKRGRLNAWKLLPGLFNGLHFYLLPSAEMKLGDCLISRKEFTSLLQYGGGSILSREPRVEDIPERERTVPYHADDSSDLKLTSHVILYGQSKAPKLKYNMVHIKTLSVEWVVGCIANWKLMDPPVG